MSVKSRKLALRGVEEERDRQDAEFGSIESLVWRSSERWIALIGEEYGECCRAVVEDEPNALLRELTDLAATTVSAIECLLLERHKV